MNKVFLRLSACICILVTLVPTALAQSGTTVTAEVDRTTISTADQLTLVLTVSGDFQQISEPHLPLLSGFNIVGSSRSSQFSMVNGAVTARTIFTYQLQPTGAGTFSIGPISVAVNGATYETDPITINVTQGTVPTQRPEPTDGETTKPPSPSGLAGEDFYVEADVDNPTPYVGEQVIYRFRFFQAVNLLNQPRLDWPPFSSFWTEDLSPNKVYDQNAAGRLYRVTEVRRAIFPTAAGQITIQPTALTISGGFFSGDINLKTEPVLVDAQELPAGAPNGFQGAVGRFEIEAWAEPLKAHINEPLTLFVRVWGAGNLTLLPDPTDQALTRLSDWRVYDPRITINVGQEGEIIQGEKLFERLLVPTKAANLTIPSFSLTYFDPKASEYRRIETGPLRVQIAPDESGIPALPSSDGSKQDILVRGSDIRHIKPAPPSLTAHKKGPLEHPLYWLGWITPPLAVFGLWVLDRHRRRLSSDIAFARAQRAHRLARNRLGKALKHSQTDVDAVYALVARALTNYLGDKLNLSSSGLTHADIRRTLTDRCVPNDLQERLTKCLDWADSGRFAPVAAGRDARDLVIEAEAVILELDQILPAAQ